MTTNSLTTAQELVAELIATSDTPAVLVGEMKLSDLIVMVESLVEQGIKDHLSENVPEDAAEADSFITNAIEQIALQVALVAVQATVIELQEQPAEVEPDAEFGLSAEAATALITALLRDKGMTIRLSVES